MRLYVGQAVNWKRISMGTHSIRRVPATIVEIRGDKVKIDLAELMNGIQPTPWVSRSSLERRPVTSSENA